MLEEEKNLLTPDEILEQVKEVIDERINQYVTSTQHDIDALEFQISEKTRVMINEEFTRYLDIIESMNRSLDARLGQFQERMDALSKYNEIQTDALNANLGQAQDKIECLFDGLEKMGDLIHLRGWK